MTELQPCAMLANGPAVDDRRVVLQRLHQVGLDGVAQQRRHRAMGLHLRGRDGFEVARQADDDAAQACLQVRQVLGQAQDGHHFGGDDDVETVLAREAVGRAAQADRDVAQRAVVHVHHAAPADAAQVDAQLVAVVDVVVDQRGQQVVRQRDGVEVAGEVQVDVFHRHHLGIAAAGRAALHAEHRAERGLAQADDGVLADAVEPVHQADRGRRLALAGRRRADATHQDQLAVGLVAQAGQVRQRNLGLVAAIGLELVFRNTQAIARELDDGPQRGVLRDLDVTLHGVSLSRRRVWHCGAPLPHRYAAPGPRPCAA